VEQIFVGQHICKDRLSDAFISKLNNLIDDELNRKAEIDYSNKLSGKIKKEYDVAHFIRQNVLQKELSLIIENAFHSYIHDPVFQWHIKFDSAWGNDQRKHEYQIVHQHSGDSPLGFSTIIYLKVPETFGPEFTETAHPTNGRTVLIGNCGGQLAETYYQIEPNVGDIYVFPYDMKHIVYPFLGEGMRRTVSCNFDLVGTRRKSKGIFI
tara:strand:- start:457 stop:1083 length:627 start_codon:yes stop_codon:yes gene_type:complete